MKDTTISVDVAKSVFEIAVPTRRAGRVKERHRLSRSAFLKFFATRRPARVLLEACGSSHHWARRLRELGHDPVLLPPHAVRPYVSRNKTDRADAKGLLEASRNEEIRPVPVKSVAQQTLGALHRLRSAWLSARTARINTVRGVLREFGVMLPLGARRVVPRVWALLEDGESSIPDTLRPVLAEACEEIRELERRLHDAERQLEQLARQTPDVTRLRTIPGVGLLTSTALVAFVGDVGRFRSGRHLASYLGLTPREHSSGLRRRLGAISKRGDRYLRTLLTHGARAVLYRAQTAKEPDRLRVWVTEVQQRRGHNKATIALANKLARIVWAVWHRKTTYEGVPVS